MSQGPNDLHDNVLAAIQDFVSPMATDLLRRALDSDHDALVTLRPIAGDFLRVLVSTNLLEFAYMPDDSDDIAWFSVENVENYHMRESVILFGMPTDILGGPITLEAVTDSESDAGGVDDDYYDESGVKVRFFQKSILSGNVGGRGGRAFVAQRLAYDDEKLDIVRTEDEVAGLVLSARARRDYDMVRHVYACYLLRLEFGQRFPELRRRALTAAGVSSLLVSAYPPKNHRFHLADPACPSFAWHTEGAPVA